MAKAEEKRKIGLKNQNPREETISARGNEIESFTVDAAKKTGLSDRTVRHDLQLSKNFDSSIKDDIKELDISKQDAIYLARLEKDKQKAIITKIKESPINKNIKKSKKLKDTQSL